mgnify:CR=1 FL=1
MSTVADLGIKMTADYADMQKAFDLMRGDLNKLTGTTQASTKAIETAMGKVPETLKETQKELSKIGTLLSSGMLIEGGKILTDVVTVPLIGLGKEAVLMADKLRQTEIAFTTLLGSAEKSGTFLRDLQAFAASTPFNFPELTQSAKKMLALGFEAEQVIPMLTNVGNAVSGLGGNAQVFDRIILALGQMQAKGAVSAEEMKQLAEAGIPAWQMLATAIGVTVPEAMDLAKKKQIDSATAIAALQDGMAQRFGGLMEQQAQTIQGTLANLQDTIGFIMTDIGREIITALNIREGLASVQEFVKSFLGWFKSLDQGTKQVLLVLTGTFALGGPILVAIGAFMAALTVITAPMLVAGAIVAGIVAGVTLILLNWQKIKDTGTAIWTSVKTTVVGTARAIYEGIVEWLVEKASAVAQRLQSVASSFAKPFEWLADHLVGHSVIPDMVEDIGRSMANLDVAMTAPARNATVNTGRVIEGAALTWQSTISQFVSALNFGWGSLAQTVGTSLAQMTTKTVDWGAVMTQLGQQVLGQMITTMLQIGAQWVLTEATRVATTQAANAAITTSTAATATGVSAVMLGMATFMKSVMLGLAKAVIGVLGVVVGAIATVLQGISVVIQFALVALAKLIFAAAAAVSPIPYIGQVLGAVLFAAGVLVSGLAVALPAIVAGLGTMLVAGVGAASAAIPAFADGGIVFGPTLGLVGEAGPEVIAPLDQLGNLTGGGEHTTIIYLDGDLLARHVDKRIRRRVSLEGGFA